MYSVCKVLLLAPYRDVEGECWVCVVTHNPALSGSLAGTGDHVAAAIIWRLRLEAIRSCRSEDATNLECEYSTHTKPWQVHKGPLICSFSSGLFINNLRPIIVDVDLCADVSIRLDDIRILGSCHVSGILSRVLNPATPSRNNREFIKMPTSMPSPALLCCIFADSFPLDC